MLIEWKPFLSKEKPPTAAPTRAMRPTKAKEAVFSVVQRVDARTGFKFTAAQLNCDMAATADGMHFHKNELCIETKLANMKLGIGRNTIK